MVEQKQIRLIRIKGFVKLTSLELGIRISLLCPHPDHPHVVPDHVVVQGRVPVHHLTSTIAQGRPRSSFPVEEQFSSLLR